MTEEKDISQRQIAAELGISVGSVNRYLQMTRLDDDYLERNDEFDDEEEEDLPEDLEERFQRFLKKFNIPDPRLKDANGNFIPVEKAGVSESVFNCSIYRLNTSFSVWNIVF